MKHGSSITPNDAISASDARRLSRNLKSRVF
jgi:hypothetical protein